MFHFNGFFYTVFPIFQLNFWVAKRQNLKNIYAQLKTPRLLRMREMLDTHQSSYAPALTKLIEDVQKSLDEAEVSSV